MKVLKVITTCIVAGSLLAVTPALAKEKPNPTTHCKPTAVDRNPNVEGLFTLYDDDMIATNFRTMDNILPSKIYGKESNGTTIIHNKKLQDLTSLEYEFDGQTQTIADLYTKTNTTGMLVMKDGKIISEDYLQGYTACSKVSSWSMAKSHVSALIGIAIGEGKIGNVNDFVINYIPELKGTGYDGVTIKQVLEMSSGIDFNENYDDPDSDLNNLIPYLYFEGGSIKQYVTNLQRESEPNTFKYKSIDTQILAWLIEKQTGKTVAKYYEEKLWKPLEMESAGFWNTDTHGNEIGFALMNSTLRDYAKFGELFRNGGKYKNKQIIPAFWVEESVTPDREALMPGVADPGLGYKYQWWVPYGAEFGKEYVAIGIYGQYTYVNEDAGVVIVKTAADPLIILNDYENIAAFRAIAASLK
ncbi:6-aminohexanoate-dimer hydrolase [compost metagenome]